MPAVTDQLVPKMQATRAELMALVERLDEAALRWCPPQGGWSVRDTLAHLVDAEHAHRSFVQAVLDDQRLHVPGFDLDRWNEEHVARRSGQSVAEILGALRAERQATLDLLSIVSEIAWEKRGNHPALGEVSVMQVIRVIGVHERMHLKEIRRLLEVYVSASP